MKMDKFERNERRERGREREKKKKRSKNEEKVINGKGKKISKFM